MADLEALAAWKAELETRRDRALDPALDAAARRAVERGRILSKGDTWTRQAVEYERELGAAPAKADPADVTKRYLAARYCGLSRGMR